MIFQARCSTYELKFFPLYKILLFPSSQQGSHFTATTNPASFDQSCQRQKPDCASSAIKLLAQLKPEDKTWLSRRQTPKAREPELNLIKHARSHYSQFPRGCFSGTRYNSREKAKDSLLQQQTEHCQGPPIQSRATLFCHPKVQPHNSPACTATHFPFP